MEPTDIEVSLTVSSCCVWSAIMSAISPGGMLEAFSMNRTLHLLQLIQLVQTRQSGISSRQFMTFVSDCFVLLCMLERDVRQCLCDTWQLIAAGSGHCLKIWICAGETGFVIPHLGVQWLRVWMRMVLCIVHTCCYIIIPGSSKKTAILWRRTPSTLCQPRPPIQCCTLNYVFGGLQKQRPFLFMGVRHFQAQHWEVGGCAGNVCTYVVVCGCL
jgi:hypothetical protein